MKPMLGRFVCCCAAVFGLSSSACLLPAASAGAKATFVTFTFTAGDNCGLGLPEVRGINSVNTVSGYCTAGGFLRTADGTVTAFAVPGATSTEAFHVNDAGVVTGFYYDNSGQTHGFVRAADGTITTFDGPKATATFALNINNRGEISGHYANGSGSHGFVRTARGRLKSFDVPGAIQTNPGCINDHGATAGYYLDAGHGVHAFVRAAGGTITTFDIPGANGGTFGGCVDLKGNVVGVYWNGNGDGEHGFIRAPDGTITTFDGQDCDISPAGINRKDTIAGSCHSHEHGDRYVGFVRHPDGALQEFHVPQGGSYTEPAGINDSGVIAGQYGGGGFLRFP